MYPTVPPRVEYHLTPLGIDAGRLTTAIAEWSVQHAPEIHTAREEFQQRAAMQPDPAHWNPKG